METGLSCRWVWTALAKCIPINMGYVTFPIHRCARESGTSLVPTSLARSSAQGPGLGVAAEAQGRDGSQGAGEAAHAEPDEPCLTTNRGPATRLWSHRGHVADVAPSSAPPRRRSRGLGRVTAAVAPLPGGRC